MLTMPLNRRSFLKLSAATGLAATLLSPDHPMSAQTSPSVTLAWDASSDATAYRVRYGTQNGTYPSVTPSVTDTSTTVDNLSPGATYYFVATALNANGQESGYSNQVSYAVPQASNAYSLFAAGSVPGTVTDSDSGSVELGVVFKASRSGQITAIRFYKGPQNLGVHTAHLWDYSGRALASATFASETASGWQQVNLSVPVQVAANTNYVASYHATKGHYSADNRYFVGARTNGTLTAPVNAGVYRYGSTSAFPNQTYQASNYWVDVVFVG